MKTFLKWNPGWVLVAAMAANVPAQELPTAPVSTNNFVDAQGQLVEDQKPLPASISPGTPAAEIVKLAQAGVDEIVMLAYISSSGTAFNLTSDAIVYLNDIGVPGSVVTAMIQHDQNSRPGAANPPTAVSAANQPIMADASSALPAQTVPVDQLPPQENVSYTYFYDSLTPYGNWINVEGYGLCWQPTVVVAHSGWQPYGDHGHWAYTDCGWYWVSDYSWGWAPFHYGRWFNHGRWGWCWAPDTVWAPAWVSWRYSDTHCGWAPLPPTACFRPNIGFTYFGRNVGFGFDFGLNVNCYTFVSLGNFCDPHPWQHRLPREHVTQIFNKTVVVNKFTQVNNTTIINNGIPVERVQVARHAPVPKINIRETTGERNSRPEQLDPNGRTLAVYRPHLPQPTETKSPFVGVGVRAAKHTEIARPAPDQRIFAQHPPTPNNNERRAENQQLPQQNQPVIIRGNQRSQTTSDNERRVGNPQQQRNQNQPIIIHGPDRSDTRGNPRNTPDNERRPENQQQQNQPVIIRGNQRPETANPRNVPDNVNRQNRSSADPTPMERTFPRSTLNQNSQPNVSQRQISPSQTQNPVRSYDNFNSVPPDSGRVQRRDSNIDRQEAPRLAAPRQESQMPPSQPSRQVTPPTYAPPGNSQQQHQQMDSHSAPPQQSAPPQSSRSQDRQDKQDRRDKNR